MKDEQLGINTESSESDVEDSGSFKDNDVIENHVRVDVAGSEWSKVIDQLIAEKQPSTFQQKIELLYDVADRLKLKDALSLISDPQVVPAGLELALYAGDRFEGDSQQLPTLSEVIEKGHGACLHFGILAYETAHRLGLNVALMGNPTPGIQHIFVGIYNPKTGRYQHHDTQAPLFFEQKLGEERNSFAPHYYDSTNLIVLKHTQKGEASGDILEELRTKGWENDLLPAEHGNLSLVKFSPRLEGEGTTESNLRALRDRLQRAVPVSSATPEHSEHTTNEYGEVN